MGRSPSHKTTRYGAVKKEVKVSCQQQFPDCPKVINENDCKMCPLYK